MLFILFYSFLEASTIFNRSHYEQIIDYVSSILGSREAVELEITKEPKTAIGKALTAAAYHTYYQKPESARGLWGELIREDSNLLFSHPLLSLLVAEDKLITRDYQEAIRFASKELCSIGAEFEIQCSYIRGLALYYSENQPNSYLHNAFAHYPQLREFWRQNKQGFTIKERSGK